MYDLTLATSTSPVGRALGLREVVIHCLDEVGHRTVVARAVGVNAEREADAAFLEHVQNPRTTFEWWVQIHIMLEDGRVRGFQHQATRHHTNGTVRQAAILHAAWCLLEPGQDAAARSGHLRVAEQLAGKPVKVVQPSGHERLTHERRQHHPHLADPPFGLRISSKPQADTLVIVLDFDAPLLSRPAVLPAEERVDAGHPHGLLPPVAASPKSGSPGAPAP